MRITAACSASLKGCIPRGPMLPHVSEATFHAPARAGNWSSYAESMSWRCWLNMGVSGEASGTFPFWYQVLQNSTWKQGAFDRLLAGVIRRHYRLGASGLCFPIRSGSHVRVPRCRRMGT